MWLDVLLFATGAFLGTPDYVNIMKGTLLSRLVIAVFAWPFLYLYLNWQNSKKGNPIENRPVLAILNEWWPRLGWSSNLAQKEIRRRRNAEKKNEC